MTRPEVGLHRLAAQVEITVLHAQVFVDAVGVVQLKGYQLRRREDDKVVYKELDGARREIGILRALGAAAQHTLYREHVLAAQGPSAPVRLGVQFWVEYHLRYAGLVPQLDKNDPAKVAAAPEPSVKYSLFSCVLKARSAAVHGPLPRGVIMSVHRLSLFILKYTFDYFNLFMTCSTVSSSCTPSLRFFTVTTPFSISLMPRMQAYSAEFPAVFICPFIALAI